MTTRIPTRLARGTRRLDTDAATAARRLLGHLRYQQYRPRHLGEGRADRWMFSATADHVRQADLRAAVCAPGYLQVMLHTCILAPAWACDYRAWVRQFLAENGEPCLCWFGVQHAPDQQVAYPHVHVGLIIAPAQSPRRWPEQVRMDHTPTQPPDVQEGRLLSLLSFEQKEAN